MSDKTKSAISDEMVEKALQTYRAEVWPVGSKEHMRKVLEATLPLAPAGSRFGWASEEELGVLRAWLDPSGTIAEAEPVRQRLSDWVQEEIDSRSGYRGPGIYRHTQSGGVWEVIGRAPAVETVYMRTHPRSDDLIFQEGYQIFDEYYVYLRPTGGESE